MSAVNNGWNLCRNSPAKKNDFDYSSTAGDDYQLDFDLFVNYRILGNYRSVMYRQDRGWVDGSLLNRAMNSCTRLTLNLDHSIWGREPDPHRYPLIPSRL